MPFTFSGKRIGVGELFDPSCTLCASNWHENLEVLYFVGGEGRVSVDTREHRVRAGDMVVVNSGLLHRVGTDSLVEYYYLIPDKDFLEENEIGTEGLLFEELFRDPVSEAFFSALISASRGEGRFRVGAMRAAVLSLLAHLGEAHAAPGTVSRTAGDNDYVKRAIEYIDGDLTRRFSVEEIAGRAGVSKYHFMRAFKRVTGYSVIEYIHVRRCNRAQILLKSGGARIAEVALACGFESVSYFSRIFKNYIGVSPKQYKELV